MIFPVRELGLNKKKRRLAPILICGFLGTCFVPTYASPVWAALSEKHFTNNDIAAAQKAFLAIDKKKWDEALKTIAKAKSPLPHKVVTWLRLNQQDPGLSFEEIAGFIAENPTWPRQTLLRQRAEEAMDEKIPAERVLKWFAEYGEPVTASGDIRLSAALLELNRKEEAKIQIRKTWIEGNLGRTQESTFLHRYKKYLTEKDHEARLERLIWEGRYYPARRMLKYVDKSLRPLAEARLLLRKVKGGVDRALAKVDKKYENDPGLIYERLRWRRIKGRDADAREILFSKLPDALPYPERWIRERVILARRAVDEGYYSEAYRLVKEHGLKAGGSDYADAEWFAGWVQLRFLKEPKVALENFQNLYKSVSYPISLSRGAYWTGRAYEAAGNKKQATAWYSKAAKHITTYYGQLAALRIGVENKQVPDLAKTPNSEEVKAFNNNEMVAVVHLLKELDRTDEMRAFLHGLNAMGTTSGWRVLTAKLAEDAGRPDLAVYISKTALQEGHGLITDGYPILPPLEKIDTPDKSLVHALIRQESAFYERAKSSVGASGLMQLMPTTASRVAKSMGLKYTRERLVEEPEYNLQLGTKYLQDLLDKFDGSAHLALAAYNAGPTRALQWVRDNGDPRQDDADQVIDWVELIPFEETRNYVQRVLENKWVYQRRLSKSLVADGKTETQKKEQN